MNDNDAASPHALRSATNVPAVSHRWAIVHGTQFVAILAGILMLGQSVVVNAKPIAMLQRTAQRGRHEDQIRLQVPFIEKRPDFGGEACLAMALQAQGLKLDQDFVFEQSQLSPLEGRGCHAKELVAAAQSIGFQTGDVWRAAPDDLSLSRYWGRILVDLRAGLPTIVCRRSPTSDLEEFVLVIGFNATSDQVIFHNPNFKTGGSSQLARKEFLRQCRLQLANVDSEPTVISLRTELPAQRREMLKAKQTKADSSQTEFSQADFAQHIRKLKEGLPSDQFHIVIEPPFVVVGDGGEAEVRRTAERTVKWAVEKIKQDYFQRNPEHIIDVWLFKDPDSYNKHNLELWSNKPGTPYGYYSPRFRVLVMDISTGGGTLVHEIVHPFMESNFPQCPSWFNEGLASLYEQSATRNGRIVGLTNWRLRGLQLAIEDKRLPSFEELCSTSRQEFYNGAGTNYAQARYLCYYLQEQGLLRTYYHEFRNSVARDPRGFETLKRVLKRDDIEQFQTEWEAFVLQLKFGN